MGFSAFGKHARNILPIMVGVVIGGVCMHWRINNPSVQLAMLFGTTLAPISGYFGWPFGILAGFLHSSVVLHAGTPVEGVNLYNNGYSGGLLAIVLYPCSPRPSATAGRSWRTRTTSTSWSTTSPRSPARPAAVSRR